MISYTIVAYNHMFINVTRCDELTCIKSCLTEHDSDLKPEDFDVLVVCRSKCEQILWLSSITTKYCQHIQIF